jgi:hypothetical protein
MKRIKLFENFNVLDPQEIVSDIETIIYELEDKKYDVEIFYKTILGDSLIKTSQYENHGDESITGNYYRKRRVDDVQEIVIVPVYKKGPRSPFSDLMTKGSIEWNNILDDFRNDMSRFIIQLKDHLDYTPSDKITLKEKTQVPPRYGFEIRIGLTK